MTDTVVIIGAGIAGAAAAQTLRAEGFDGSITLLGAEPTLPYRRPTVSKEHLAASPPPIERTLVQPATFWSDNRIDLRTGSRVTRLDATGRSIELENGEQLRYDAALIATGATAVPFGAANGRVHTLRTVADATRLHAALTAGDSLLVLGAGLIGCEVAAAARRRGLDVTVLEQSHAPMSRILPADIARTYVSLHADQGVDIHTGVTLSSLQDNGSGVVARAVDGRTWHADVALAAIGSAPDTALARTAGLDIGDGILVDDRFATSEPGVYAAGDVASIPHPLGGRYRSQHWNSARAHGEAAAKAILGQRTTAFEVPWGWSTQYGHTLQFAGWPSHDDRYAVNGTLDEHDFLALARRGERVVGAIGIGRQKDFRQARTLIAVESLVGSRGPS